jgi:hypothetical protein
MSPVSVGSQLPGQSIDLSRLRSLGRLGVIVVPAEREFGRPYSQAPY